MLIRWNCSIDHGFDISLDRGQRRTEVVGYIGNERLSVFIGTTQLVCHFLHISCQFTKFIIGMNINSRIEISGGILLGGCNDFTDWF